MMTPILVTLLVSGLAHAEHASVKLNTDASDQDTSILIHRGPQVPTPNTPPDYEIHQEQVDIAGDPADNQQESYKKWKTACADWRKELKETHGNLLIHSDCGRPHIEKDPVTFQKTQISKGTFKVKVSLRNLPSNGSNVVNTAPASQPAVSPQAPMNPPSANPAPTVTP